MTTAPSCFIGNSHLACIRIAWKESGGAYGADESVDFFASSASTMLELRTSGSVLVPENDELLEQIRYTSGGKSSIDTADYGQFFIFGLSFGFRTTLEMARRSETLSHRQWVGARNLVSDAAFEQAIEDLLNFSSGAQLARMIKAVSDKPITLVCQPCPGEGLLDRKGYLRFQKAVGTQYLEDLYETFKRIAQKVGERNGWRIVFQPEDTLSHPGFTKAVYAKEGVGVKKQADSPDDDKHMNPLFGEAQLKAILGLVTSEPA